MPKQKVMLSGNVLLSNKYAGALKATLLPNQCFLYVIISCIALFCLNLMDQLIFSYGLVLICLQECVLAEDFIGHNSCRSEQIV